MRVIVFVNCDSPAFAEGRDTAELSAILHQLSLRVKAFRDLEQIDWPLPIKDSQGDTVGRLTVTADPE